MIHQAGASSLLGETLAEDSPDVLHQSPSKGQPGVQGNVPCEMPMSDIQVTYPVPAAGRFLCLMYDSVDTSGRV